MTTTISVNRQCSRCPRIDQEEVSLQEVTKLAKTGLETPDALRIVIDGEEEYAFNQLCQVCRQIVGRTLGKLCKKLKHQSSLRETKDDSDPEAKEEE